MRFITIALALCLFSAFAQTPPAAPAPEQPAVEKTSDPQIVLGFGAGGSQYADPHYALTGFIGFRVAGGTYETTSLDYTSKLDPGTGKRVPLSVIRTGGQHRLAQQGKIGLWVSGDIGLAKSDNVVASLSGGGAITYDIRDSLFAYIGMRVIKAPQPDVLNPAAVQTAFSAGIGLKFDGKK